jgi:hypothetical protein
MHTIYKRYALGHHGIASLASPLTLAVLKLESYESSARHRRSATSASACPGHILPVQLCSIYSPAHSQQRWPREYYS